jgi:hypothetical protein
VALAGMTDAEARLPRLEWEALADCADLFGTGGTPTEG